MAEENRSDRKQAEKALLAAELVSAYSWEKADSEQSGKPYAQPDIGLLLEPEQASDAQRAEDAEKLYLLYKEHLEAYGVRATVDDYFFNDFAVIFRVRMMSGEPADRLLRLRADFEMRLGCPIEVMLSDSGHVVMAAKSLTRPVYPIRKLIDSEAFRAFRGDVPIAMGVNLMGGDFLIDLADIGNLLVVGTTGSGKSTFLNSMIVSLLYRFSPKELQMVLIDPKVVDLQAYAGLPHSVFGVISEAEKALKALRWALAEAQVRMQCVTAAKCGSFEEYNLNADRKLSRIVVVIEEYSELMMQQGKELEDLIRQMVSRTLKSGVHIILSTQRPSPDVVSPKIKTAIPCRASFTVVDRRESNMAIFRTGAERLLGLGDMIYSMRSDKDAVHIQAAYVSQMEADRIVKHIASQTEQEKPVFLLHPELIGEN